MGVSLKILSQSHSFYAPRVVIQDLISVHHISPVFLKQGLEAEGVEISLRTRH
jgi:hypothetical protein